MTFNLDASLYSRIKTPIDYYNEAEKNKAQIDSTKILQAKTKIDLLNNLAYGIKDEATYNSARDQLSSLGLDPKELGMPDSYNNGGYQFVETQKGSLAAQKTQLDGIIKQLGIQNTIGQINDRNAKNTITTDPRGAGYNPITPIPTQNNSSPASSAGLEPVDINTPTYADTGTDFSGSGGTPPVVPQVAQDAEGNPVDSVTGAPIKADAPTLDDAPNSNGANAPIIPASPEIQWSKQLQSAGYKPLYDGKGLPKVQGTKQAFQGPDGATVYLSPPKGLEQKPLTESQASSGTYADRMFKANEILNDVGGEGLSLKKRAQSGVPVVGNFLVDSNYQKFDQAKRDFLSAVLRKESGAAISTGEFANGDKQYFPQPGDSTEVIEQKKQNRLTAMEGIARGAGPTYVLPKPTKKAEANESKGGKAPKLGTIEKGEDGVEYIFNGGDPADQKNWKKK